MPWKKIEHPLPEQDFVLQLKVDGKKLCLIRHIGIVYATQNTCPHAGGNLSGGWCKDGKLICPLHRYAYDLKTGRGNVGQGDYIDVYPVEEREDGVYVDLKESWLKRIFG